MKKKIIILVGIALCAMLLISPALAGASENVLEIYGNANEDDTIDMRDLTYEKLIFFGKKPETELADAKYDGKINPLDFIQIKLIIVGKEKELTVEVPVDAYRTEGLSEIVTIHKPVKRIVVQMPGSTDVLRALNAADKIVGVGGRIQDSDVYYPELCKRPSVGISWSKPDYEAVLNLDPDLFLAFSKRSLDEEKLPGVTVLGMSLWSPEGFTERVRLLGYIIDKREEAEEYINWHDGWINEIKSRIETLSDDEKPRVFTWISYTPGERSIYAKYFSVHQMCDVAGGCDVAEDLRDWQKVDIEWLMEQNPDIIIVQTYSGIHQGYDADDPSEMASAREEILNRPELANVLAVKNGNVFMMDWIDLANGGSACLIGTTYFAKWFHPELFEDLDPKAIHQEYLTRFQRIDYDLDKHGVFVYLEPS